MKRLSLLLSLVLVGCAQPAAPQTNTPVKAPVITFWNSTSGVVGTGTESGVLILATPDAPLTGAARVTLDLGRGAFEVPVQAQAQADRLHLGIDLCARANGAIGVTYRYQVYGESGALLGRGNFTQALARYDFCAGR